MALAAVSATQFPRAQAALLVAQAAIDECLPQERHSIAKDVMEYAEPSLADLFDANAWNPLDKDPLPDKQMLVELFLYLAERTLGDSVAFHRHVVEHLKGRFDPNVEQAGPSKMVRYLALHAVQLVVNRHFQKEEGLCINLDSLLRTHEGAEGQGRFGRVTFTPFYQKTCYLMLVITPSDLGTSEGATARVSGVFADHMKRVAPPPNLTYMRYPRRVAIGKTRA